MLIGLLLYIGTIALASEEVCETSALPLERTSLNSWIEILSWLTSSYNLYRAAECQFDCLIVNCESENRLILSQHFQSLD